MNSSAELGLEARLPLKRYLVRLVWVAMGSKDVGLSELLARLSTTLEPDQGQARDAVVNRYKP